MIINDSALQQKVGLQDMDLQEIDDACAEYKKEHDYFNAYPYQKGILEGVWSAMLHGIKPIVHVPTGGGKGAMINILALMLSQKSGIERVYIICPNKYLAQQHQVRCSPLGRLK